MPTVCELKRALRKLDPKAKISMNKPALMEALHRTMTTTNPAPSAPKAKAKAKAKPKPEGKAIPKINQAKIDAMLKTAKAGVSKKKVSDMINVVKSAKAKKESAPARKPDNLPFNLMMNIRKMATDSSRNDFENPQSKLYKILDNAEKDAKKFNKKFMKSKKEGSFAKEKKDFKKRFKPYHVKDMPEETLDKYTLEYIKLGKRGCKIHDIAYEKIENFKKEYDAFFIQHRPQMDKAGYDREKVSEQKSKIDRLYRIVARDASLKDNNYTPGETNDRDYFVDLHNRASKKFDWIQFACNSKAGMEATNARIEKEKEARIQAIANKKEDENRGIRDIPLADYISGKHKFKPPKKPRKKRFYGHD